ncbi:non-canonical purine NTP pyrophosphatase [Haloarcula marina]|uniref:non-canonical purine NTP pyrophosphatase n=1 Tax=Haloarcula marina TaxID=2961574 RepID=UPI0020B89946|nr:non-canonical purine NTP pyrophosphatase [Halomicroarcula marina]
MLNFVTTNPGKVREATEYLDDEVAQFDFDYPEIQADDLGAVAAHGARSAYRAADGPVIVDDAGLFIDAFDGFPGPYSSYVEDTVGVERVWRMTEPEDDHAAAFKTVIAYCDGEEFAATPDPVDREERRGQDLGADERGAATTDEQVHGGEDALPVKLFEGRVPGELVAPRGDGGFGFDPIFEHDGKTFAEMTTEQKNAVSHRGRALAKFAEWYAER